MHRTPRSKLGVSAAVLHQRAVGWLGGRGFLDHAAAGMARASAFGAYLHLRANAGSIFPAVLARQFSRPSALALACLQMIVLSASVHALLQRLLCCSKRLSLSIHYQSSQQQTHVLLKTHQLLEAVCRPLVQDVCLCSSSAESGCFYGAYCAAKTRTSVSWTNTAAGVADAWALSHPLPPPSSATAKPVGLGRSGVLRGVTWTG